MDFYESQGGYGFTQKDIYPIISHETKNGMLCDIKGKEYFDFFSGCCTNSFGLYPSIVETIKKQSEKLISYYDYLHTERLKLSENIVKHTSPDYKVMYMVSGSQAIELAIRFAVYNNPKAHVYIYKSGFHGTCMGTNQLCNRPARDKYYFPNTLDIKSVTHYMDVPAGNIFIIEPYESANMGGHIRDNEELENTVKHCKNNNITLIWDEIQTGMGRTGDLFVCNKINYWPDILVAGKCIANGLPLSAIMFNSKKLKDWDGNAYSSTFNANPLACAVGNEVFRLLYEENWLTHIKETGYYFDKVLKETFPNCARAEGLYGYITLPNHKNLLKKCLDNGLYLRYTKEQLLLTPKYTVSKSDIDSLIYILKKDVLKGD